LGATPVVLAADETGRGKVDRLLAGAALAVHGDAGHGLRPAGGEDGAAGDVEGLLADLAHAAPDHIVDLARVGQAGPLGQRVQHMGRQVNRVHPGQGAVPLAHRRPNGRHDHRVAHRALLLPRRPLPAYHVGRGLPISRRVVRRSVTL
jgi:hypothetical protein